MCVGWGGGGGFGVMGVLLFGEGCVWVSSGCTGWRVCGEVCGSGLVWVSGVAGWWGGGLWRLGGVPCHMAGGLGRE